MNSTFFPLSYLAGGQRTRGYSFPWPAACDRCDRQCQRSTSAELATCSYGVNYIRVSDSVLLFGFLIQTPHPSSAQKKALRKYPDSVVPKSEFETALSALNAKQLQSDAAVRDIKHEVLRRYLQDREYARDLLDLLQPELKKAFASLHDYKQFVARVRQNINVVLESRYPGGTIDEKLAHAFPAEAAIYWSSILMEEKLRVAFLLLDPEHIAYAGDSPFRMHGLVVKYIRIYNSAFREKNVVIRTEGESRGEVRGDSALAGVIPHTLIDNALKYSPRGSEVVVRFVETADAIDLSVRSYGPKIEERERDRIFEIFYRGKHAEEQEAEGAGFGLYVAQLVAFQLGTRIDVSQTKTSRGYLTEFRVHFRREA